MTTRILIGDCRDVLRSLPSESVHCVVTSPPYFSLRNYGIAPSIWGGASECEHEWGDEISINATNHTMKARWNHTRNGRDELQPPEKRVSWLRTEVKQGQFCQRCGAWAGALGLEPTPQIYVEHSVEIFREVRRVLRADGTLWLNMGDSYCGAGYSNHANTGGASTTDGGKQKHGTTALIGIKSKDLCGMPWRVAFALQADGWFLRQDIIWCLSGGTWLYAQTPTKVGPMMLKDLIRLDPATVELWNGERWTRVTAWARRQGRTGARELVLRSGERIGCTDNHVWPTGRGNLRTDDIRRGDIIQTARLPDSNRPAGWLTPEAFWFAGLFLAEGSRSGATIQISGHVKEEFRLARLRDLVAHYGGTARAYNHVGKSQNIHIDSIGLSAVLDALIAGRTAKDKHLRPSAWHYRNWALAELARGYLDGDGAQDGTRIRLGFCRNYSLERDLRTLSTRLGATLTLKPSMSKSHGKAFPSFRGEWRWERSGHRNERDRGEVMEVRRSRARQFWDVTVADYPNLFALASGVLTHNSKPNPMPESVTDRCTKSHEYLFLLSKSARYYFDAEAIKENVSGGAHPHGSGYGQKVAAAGEGIKNNDSFVHAVHNYIRADLPTSRNKRSVWTVASQPYPGAHFAMFPPALVEPAILAGCPPNGTVLDCFGGAGTTGLVADRLQRDAILIEFNPTYTEMAKQRIHGDAPLFIERPKPPKQEALL
jgi:DNA modification methylase